MKPATFFNGNLAKIASVSLKGVALFGALVAMVQCTPQGKLVSKLESPQGALETNNDICVSIEGNGENFSSHIGGFIAMLEQDLNPKVVSGGSSGSVIAVLVRALLSNSSLQNGDKSSLQNAALVLAAGKPVFESLIFLPSLNDIGTAIKSAALTLGSAALGRGFVSNPDYAVAHAEAILGQNIIAAQFFRDADFSGVLQERDLAARVKAMEKLWVEMYNFKRVNPQEFVEALLTPAALVREQGVRQSQADIRKRYFALFDSPIDQEGKKTPAEMLAEHERMLDQTANLNIKIVRDSAQEIFKQAIELMRPAPFIGALSASVDKPFLLPDEKVLAKAMRGFDRNGKEIAIPDGAVIHTTARLGELRATIPAAMPKRKFDGVDTGSAFERIDDKPGFQFLYQLYFANEDMTQKFHEAQLSNKQSGLLFYVENGIPKPLLWSAKNAQAIGGLSLAEAVSVSISEPGFFRRTPLVLANYKLAHESVLPDPFKTEGAYVLSFGGWLDTSASQTLALLPDCDPKKISRFAYIHPNRAQNPFQASALQDVNNRAREIDQVNINEMMERIGKYLIHSRRAVTGMNPSLDLAWNWDDPMGKDNPHNLKVKQNRGVYLYTAYSAFRGMLENALPEGAFNHSSSFGSEALIDVAAEINAGKPIRELERQIFGE